MSSPEPAFLPDLCDEMLALVSLDKVQVPPYPAVAMQISKVIQKGNFGLEELAVTVSTDPALSAGILRAANSAFYGRGAVGTISKAVARLGAKEVARLSLIAGLSDAARREGALAPLRRHCWQQGVASGALCMLLARKRRLPEEEAFVCGLLHDFGWLLALAALEEILRAHPRHPPRSEAFWKGLMDQFHITFGAALASRWKLPEAVADVIFRHHAEHVPGKPGAALLDLVVVSDKISLLLDRRPGVTAADLATISGLTEDECALLARVIPELPAMIAAFDGTPRGPRESSCVEPPATTLPEQFRPLELEVRQADPTRKRTWLTVCIAATGWVMVGPEALVENQLVQLELVTKERPLLLWARVTLCQPTGAQVFRLDCKPFALGASALEAFALLAQGSAA
jgi:HD-like signal output (HDOD) protein